MIRTASSASEERGKTRMLRAPLPRRLAVLLMLPVAVAVMLLLLAETGPAAAQGAAGTEPANIQVMPGDGILTVSWTVTSRPGVADGDIRHALRWSQEAGVWNNPAGATPFVNDGVAVDAGQTSYTITGLKNGVVTGVHVRSFTGVDWSEQGAGSSRWVRVKGESTTPRSSGPKTYSVTATASAVEGSDATLTATLNKAAPYGGVEFAVTAGYGSDASATAGDVGAITSPVTMAEGDTTLELTVPTSSDEVDEDDETFIVTIAATTGGWEKEGDGKDTATITIQDDDTAGVTVTPTALNVAEGGTGTYTAVLDSKPTSDVTVTPTSSDGGAASVSPASYTFTPGDWDTARTFTVSGVADDDAGNESVSFSHGVVSNDAKYSGIAVDGVSVAVADDDTPVDQTPPKDGPPQPQQQVTEACAVRADGNYDRDFDGLIEVCNLAQLNAIRWDADGNGAMGNSNYKAAFPGAASRVLMGCPISSGCKGYELVDDLDFDTNGNGEADAGDTYWNGGKGWTPIRFGVGGAIVFDGNGHTISNLFVDAGPGVSAGLFNLIHGAIVRNVGLESVDVTGQGAAGGLTAANRGQIQSSYVNGSVWGQGSVGGLAGASHGKIIGSHTAGTVSGGQYVGGLVGWSVGFIGDSYSTADVSVIEVKPSGRREGEHMTDDGNSVRAFGGLVGYEFGTIRGSYATGDVTANEAFVVGGLVGFTQGADIFASYAAGDVSGYDYVGGLVGVNFRTPITASYALGSVSGGEHVGGLAGQHSRVFSRVNHHRCSSCAIHRSGITDSYWNIQAEGQTATQTVHRDQLAISPTGSDRTTAELQAPTDYTGIYANWNALTDGKGSSDLWDFGTSSQYPVLKHAGPGVAEQRAQLPEPSAGPVVRESPTGPGTDYDTDDDGLIEVSNLDQLNAIRLDQGGDGDGCCHYNHFVPSPYRGDPNVPNPERWDIPAAFPDPMDGMGCPSSGCIGYELVADLDFDTNGNGKADAGDAYYDGYPHSGWNIDNGWRPILSFVGVFDGNGHTIRNLYISSPRYEAGPVRAGLFNAINPPGIVRNLALENVSVSGGGYPVGGLAGSNSGRISGVYVTGTVSGWGSVGGLVGESGGPIFAAYSTASVTGGSNNVGGLVGINWGGVTASYATGAVTGNGNNVGGLTGSGNATNSYWDTQTSGRSSGGGGTGKTTAELQTPTGYTGIYANWKVDVDGDKTADDLWEFGSDNEYPTLKNIGGAPPEETPGTPHPPAPTTETRGTFSVSAAASAAEGADATLTITLSEAAPADGVAFTVAAGYSGDATATALDVGGITSPVTVAEDDTTLEIAIPTIDDDLDEDDETFTVVIDAATPGWEKEGDGKDTATITITDDDTAAVTISPVDLTINEGGTATYSLILESMPSNLVHITAISGDGGALSVDPETYVISPSDWNTARTFTVTGVADADADNESVTISHSINGLQDAKYSSVTAPSLTVTVQDTTPRNFSLSRAASAAEGSDATLTVTLTATAPAGGAEFGVAVNHGSGAGKADAADMGAVPQTVTVAAGAKTATLTIPLAEDALTEDDETFTVTLTPPSGWTAASAGDDTATVTITDVPPEPERQTQEPEKPGPVENLQVSLTVDGVTVSWEAPQSGGAPNKYIVRLTPADGGKDKVKEPKAGKTSVTFGNPEASATYQVKVRAQNGAGKSDPVRANVTVPQLPGPPVNLQLLATADSITATWEAPQSGGNPGGYLLNVKNTDSGEDELHSVGADATTATFGNLEAGASYRVWVRAVNAGGKGERVRATATLPEAPQQEPPPEPQKTARTYAVTATARATEGGSATLTITLSEAAPVEGVAFTVTATYAGQTAEAADVGSITSPVTVLEGDATLEIAIPTASDAVDEEEETFIVTVAATTEGWEKEGDGKDAATVTITDDDTAGVTVTPSALNVSEDGNATYTVVMASQPTADVTVTASTSDGGAADVSPASYTFTSSDWNTARTFTVSGAADEDRDNESVSISHFVASSDGKYSGISVDGVSVAVTDTTPPPAQVSCPEEAGPPVPGQTEPYNVCVTPGDSTLTVTWTMSPRDGVSDDDIRHALRWSQESGVWANPPGPSGAAEDGIVVEGGVATYTITGLKNGVATGVFVRSFVGSSASERSSQSSQWVRIKGGHTTPRAAE